MKRIAAVLVLVPGLALAQAPGRRQHETTEQATGAKAKATASPGPGIEAGTANPVGRTDVGPTGRTGIEGVGLGHDQSMARAYDQFRGANEKDSFLRPAESPPDIAIDLKPMGSGAAEGAFPMGGTYYADGHEVHGKANGIASGPGSPGGAAAQGTAGKSAQIPSRPDPRRKAAPHAWPLKGSD
jgi:hypothetical protein